ncbi:synaptotagmin-like protein 3 [Bombina bombina]|uniref:synaptotagmin-like protein 3 n=2 Tax=Bombina bombina TaxID=8345 RepID=UPI00235AF239|nr:synaptotagmin-like protein 3 [Bombina bombina]
MAIDFNLSFLKELERERVLEVLYRDQSLQKLEEERVRKLKAQLQQLRWKGAKSVSREYEERSCARCQKPLGRLLNRGAVCDGCSHRVCQECQVFLQHLMWKCTVCYAHGEVKIQTGEWFFELREKKFPSTGKQETVGSKLLKTYQKMSKISVVPPTPPPFHEVTPLNTLELSKSKGFNKSVENLFLSLTSQVKKISKSQNDMTEKYHLTTDYGQKAEKRKEKRSHSDTAINIASELEKSNSLHHLIHKAKEEEMVEKRQTKHESDEETSSMKKRVFFGVLKRESMCSISSSCTETESFDNADITGEIEFAISYNFKFCTLEISIKACKNLAYGEEKKRKCNPYIKTYLKPDKSSNSKMKTSVKKNTVDPLFHETLKYNIEYCQLGTRILQVSVWHASALKRKVFLGEVSIPLESWDFQDNSAQSFNWYQLRAKPKKHEEGMIQYHGELCVRVRLAIPPVCNKFQYGDYTIQEVKKPELSQLHVVINDARNLSLRPDGNLSSYVKSCLVLPNKREMKQKTPVLRKQICPTWQHTFVFNIQGSNELKKCHLDLTVWDQASLGLNDRFLGGARLITAEDTSESECYQSAEPLWQRLLNRPNEWIEETIVLHSNMGRYHF